MADWTRPTEWLLEQVTNLAEQGSDAIIGKLENTVENLESVWRPNVNDNTLGQSKYDFTQRVFPSDIGAESSYNGHYMVININVQDQSNYSSINGKTMFTRLPNELSKADALRYTIDKNFYGADGQNTDLSQGNRLTRPRFTKRIAESIAIYMPNSELSFVDAHEFENISMTRIGAQAAGGIVTGGATALGGIFGGAITGIGSGMIAGNVMDAAGSVIKQYATAAGFPINPKVEVLFSNTFQREFAFEFLMSPSNEQESKTIEQIIRTLRFHAAPEIRTGASGLMSFFYVPPSEFDISFFYRGVENTHIPRISTCVLTQIDVSYAPSGIFSTFHNGYPVNVRMMLRFRETEAQHRLRVSQGF